MLTHAHFRINNIWIKAQKGNSSYPIQSIYTSNALILFKAWAWKGLPNWDLYIYVYIFTKYDYKFILLVLVFLFAYWEL